MRTLRYYHNERENFARIRNAAEAGIWDGKTETPYFASCRWHIEKFQCSAIYTRDVGYHSNGWWKNPDYERCYHLSLCWYAGTNRVAFNKIINSLFGRDKKLLWTEPPYSQKGKQEGIWHYRLFCDPQWRSIKPRGEVYSTQFTELGWKSFSELRN